MTPEQVRAQEVDAEIGRMAEISPSEYQVTRQDAAKRLGVSLEYLDKTVQNLRKVVGLRNGGGALPPEAATWTEPVHGAALLDALCTIVRKHVALPKGADIAVALWVLHAWAFEASFITPRLVIKSPEKRCGKTALLRMISVLVPRKLMAADITASAMFRTIEHSRPTLLIDEGDIGLKGNEALRSVINSGHGKDGVVYRTENDEPKQFSTWTPVAIALIGDAADTIEDRAVPIRMRRRRKDEQIERLRADRPEMFEHLRSKARRWAADNVPVLAELDPEVPDCLNDRAADNWRPLLAIADLAGGEWPQLAREAAVFLSMDADEEDSSAKAMLLSDIRAVFSDRDDTRLDDEWRGRILSHHLCAMLIKLEDRPWADWRRGKPITPRDLASLLKGYEIRPKDVKSTYGSVRKGYDLEDFRDAFDRYLPPSSGTASATSISEVAENSSQDNVVAQSRESQGLLGPEGFRPKTKKKATGKFPYPTTTELEMDAPILKELEPERAAEIENAKDKLRRLSKRTNGSPVTEDKAVASEDNGE